FEWDSDDSRLRSSLLRCPPSLRPVERRRKSFPSRTGLFVCSKWQRDAQRNRTSAQRRQGPATARRERARDDPQAPHLHASRRTVDWHLRGNEPMKIFVFGSSITSSYWNGAA